MSITHPVNPRDAENGGDTMLKQTSNQKPKAFQANESIRLFILRVQPAQFDLAWYATLEDEHQPQLEFRSPLELARYLADLNPNEPSEKTRTNIPTGLR
jgi:hypothetical protein